MYFLILQSLFMNTQEGLFFSKPDNIDFATVLTNVGSIDCSLTESLFFVLNFSLFHPPTHTHTLKLKPGGPSLEEDTGQ